MSARLDFDFLSFQGILQQAETLYTMGDFEFALVFYHRGYKLWPDREFKVGIQKAQEAINNSVGSEWPWAFPLSRKSRRILRFGGRPEVSRVVTTKRPIGNPMRALDCCRFH